MSVLRAGIRGLSPVVRQSTYLQPFAAKSSSSSSGYGDGGSGSNPFNNNDRVNDMITSYQGADHEFGPYRDREQAADCIDYHNVQIQRDSVNHDYPDAESRRSQSMAMDSHIDSYDKQGSISLHSVMQSMVPEPFQPVSEYQNPGPNNMPGGNANQQQISLKYTSEIRSGRNDPAGEIV